MTAVLICGGDITAAFLQNYLEQHTDAVVYAVDGGLTVADRAQVMPDVLVGDFDTADETLVAGYECRCRVLRHVPEKDATDTELAVDDALAQGADRIVLLGATGSRMDHTLANIHMLYRILEQKKEGFLVNENNRISLHNASFFVRKENLFGMYLSFLPFYGDVKGLVLSGVKYPLSGKDMTAGNSLGVSNEAKDDIIKVSFEAGYLLMIEARD